MSNQEAIISLADLNLPDKSADNDDLRRILNEKRKIYRDAMRSLFTALGITLYPEDKHTFKLSPKEIGYEVDRYIIHPQVDPHRHVLRINMPIHLGAVRFQLMTPAVTYSDNADKADIVPQAMFVEVTDQGKKGLIPCIINPQMKSSEDQQQLTLNGMGCTYTADDSGFSLILNNLAQLSTPIKFMKTEVVGLGFRYGEAREANYGTIDLLHKI